MRAHKHTHTNTHTLCMTPFANLLTGSCSEWIDAEGVWKQWIVGNCRESNESPPGGLLPGIATHLWLLSSRCPGNSSAWWETIILSKCVCVQTCVFISILKAKLFTIDLDPLKLDVYSATPNSEGLETALKRSFFLFACFSKIENRTNILQQWMFDKTGGEESKKHRCKTDSYGGHVSLMILPACEV